MTEITEIFLNMTETIKILKYSSTWIKTHESELGLQPRRTAGGFRRYSLNQVLEAAKLIEGRAHGNAQTPNHRSA
jgi:DNA-binding transcriptional MerR regulator